MRSPSCHRHFFGGGLGVRRTPQPPTNLWSIRGKGVRCASTSLLGIEDGGDQHPLRTLQTRRRPLMPAITQLSGRYDETALGSGRYRGRRDPVGGHSLHFGGTSWVEVHTGKIPDCGGRSPAPVMQHHRTALVKDQFEIQLYGGPRPPSRRVRPSFGVRSRVRFALSKLSSERGPHAPGCGSPRRHLYLVPPRPSTRPLRPAVHASRFGPPSHSSAQSRQSSLW